MGPRFRAQGVWKYTPYVWMPSAYSLGGLKIIHTSIAEPGRIVRSCGESRNVQPQRNKEDYTLCWNAWPSWWELLIKFCVMAFSQCVLVRALNKFCLVLFLPGLTEPGLGSPVSGASMNLVQLPIARDGGGPERPIWQNLSSSVCILAKKRLVS